MTSRNDFERKRIAREKVKAKRDEEQKKRGRRDTLRMKLTDCYIVSKRVLSRCVKKQINALFASQSDSKENALVSQSLVGLQKHHRSIYFFLLAFSAALVTLPAFSVLSTALMTPTATVCLMSRTANRPRGG